MTDKPALRQVLLLHEPPSEPPHFDWMLELPVPREYRLITFRTRRRVDGLLCADLDLPRLPDHRARYLDFQGLIDDARGSVRRIATGQVLRIRANADQIDALIIWHARPLSFIAHPSTLNRWRVTIRPSDETPAHLAKGFP